PAPALGSGGPEPAGDRFASDVKGLGGAFQQALRPFGGDGHPLELLQRSARAVVSHGHVAAEPIPAPTLDPVHVDGVRAGVADSVQVVTAGLRHGSLLAGNAQLTRVV